MTWRARIDAACCRAADLAATPEAIGGFLLACAAWVSAGLPVEMLTMTLSVLAITTTQMVLAAQKRERARDETIKRELLRAVPDADEHVAD